jgi:hypothetical protein
VPKRARRLGNIDEMILSLYSRGMTTADIAAHLREVYGVDASKELISNVTDVVVDEIKAWQSRPLDEARAAGSATGAMPSSTRIGDRRDRLLEHLGAIHLGQMRGDLPGGQPLLRLERAVPIPRHRDRHRPTSVSTVLPRRPLPEFSPLRPTGSCLT